MKELCLYFLVSKNADLQERQNIENITGN